MEEKAKKAKVLPMPIISAQPTKMRIKLFDKGLLISDRLVEQVTEFNTGPKAMHKGPISVEFNLSNQEEVDLAIAYMQKIKGDIPIVLENKKVTGKKLDKMLSEKEPIIDLLKTIKAKATSQEKLIEMLREYNYKFLTTQAVQDLNEEKEVKMITLKDRDAEYQWMARLIKEAKNPSLDKYDFRLTFGIKLNGDKVNRVRVYLFGEYSETLTLEWDKTKIVNFKKVDLMFAFPEWMDLDDRKAWRMEHRKWRTATDNGKNPEAWQGFSKAYNKALPYVKSLG